MPLALRLCGTRDALNAKSAGRKSWSGTVLAERAHAVQEAKESAKEGSEAGSKVARVAPNPLGRDVVSGPTYRGGHHRRP